VTGSRRRAGARLLPCVLVLALLAGCGLDGGDGVDRTAADEWMHELCTAMSSWHSRIDAEAGELNEGLAADATPEEGRDAVAAFLDEAIAVTEALLGDVRAAGVPDVDDGEQLAAEYAAAIAEARDVFADARAGVESMPVDDPEGFAVEAQAIGAQIEEGAQGVQAAFSDIDRRYDAPELDRAFEREPACAALS
jgi:hypothetical protein